MLDASENLCHYCGLTVNDDGSCPNVDDWAQAKRDRAEPPVPPEDSLEKQIQELENTIWMAGEDGEYDLVDKLRWRLENLHEALEVQKSCERDVGRSFKNVEFDNPLDYHNYCADDPNQM